MAKKTESPAEIAGISQVVDLADHNLCTGKKHTGRKPGVKVLYNSDGLPTRQVDLINRLAQGETQATALRNAGYNLTNDKNASDMVRRIKNNIREKLLSALEKQGLTMEHVALRLKENIDSMMIVRTGKDTSQEVADTRNRNETIKIVVDIVGGNARKEVDANVRMTVEHQIRLMHREVFPEDEVIDV